MNWHFSGPFGRHRIQRLRGTDLPALLPDILTIEVLCFPRPWGEDIFTKDVADADCSLAVVLVGRDREMAKEKDRSGPRAVAFCSCRKLYDELHVLQIATHPDHQRRGYGGDLLVHAVHMAGQLGCAALLLEVRRTNRAAIALYEKNGFQQAGLRRHYYADNGEDALVMRCQVAI